MKKIKFNTTHPSGVLVKAFSVLTLLLVSVACVDDFELPEAGSIADLTPPKANFSAVQSDNFLIYNFSNTSNSATDFAWDFGDGGSSNAKEPQHEFPAEGTYTVTLVATDKLNARSTVSKVVTVEEPPAPPAITPEIVNGDFEDSSYDAWKVDTFSDGTTRNPYNGSSDGEPMLYDGTPADSKTRGAKWTSSTSAGYKRSASSRFAYQSVTVSPEREYIIEYSYAIKNDKADAEGGDRVIVEILDGHFTDGVAAEASSTAGPIVRHVGDVANGKGNFSLVREQFTAPATGLIAIWMYAVTNEDAYIDNVKIYPAE